MKQTWILLGCSLALFSVIVEGRTLIKRDAYDDLDPTLQEVEGEDVVRDKRHQDVKFGVKNALLGFVFNPSSGSSHTAAKPRVLTTTTKKPTTTQDIVIFEKDKPVSLDFPGELFGSSFNLVTNLSETVGDFMINSALRTQRLLESMRPFLRAIFGAKGLVIEATTDKPIFSDPNAANDV